MVYLWFQPDKSGCEEMSLAFFARLLKANAYCLAVWKEAIFLARVEPFVTVLVAVLERIWYRITLPVNTGTLKSKATAVC